MTRSRAERPEPKRHERLYIENITFLVQDTEFSLPKHLFQDGSQSFWGIQGIYEERVVAGQKYPLKGTTVDEFDNFADVLYPLRRKDDTASDITPRGWLAVLKLSHRWGFESVKAAAVNYIDSIPKTSIKSGFQLLTLYHDYHIHHWLIESLRILSTNNLLREDPEFQDLFREEIGEEFTRRVIHLQGLVGGICYKGRDGKVSADDIDMLIRSVFPEVDG